MLSFIKVKCSMVSFFMGIKSGGSGVSGVRESRGLAMNTSVFGIASRNGFHFVVHTLVSTKAPLA